MRLKNKIAKPSLIFLSFLLLVFLPAKADYAINVFTGQMDYYETGLPAGGAAGGITYFDGTDWQNLAVGANGLVLTVAAGTPTWAAAGAPGAHAASHAGGAADPVNHNTLANYVAAEHLDWTADQGASNIHDNNILASSVTQHVASIDHNLLLNYVAGQHLVLPNTIAVVLTDHNVAAHNALNITQLGTVTVGVWNGTAIDISANTNLAVDANELTLTGDSLGLADHATARTALGLAIGSDIQAWDTDLDTYAGITPSANIQTFLGAVNYAAMMAQLSGTATAVFDFNSQILTGVAGIEGPAAALDINTDVVQDVNFWDTIASGNPSINIYGWNTAGGDRESTEFTMDDTNDEFLIRAANSANHEGITIQNLEANQLFRFRGSDGNVKFSINDAGAAEAIDLEVNESFTFDAFQTATGDGDTTIDWGLGNNMYFTFGAQNEIIRFTAPPGSAVVRMIIKQDGVGSRTIDWSNIANILWPGNVEPTLSTTAAYVDIIVFLYDGTSWHGLFNGDFR